MSESKTEAPHVSKMSVKGKAGLALSTLTLVSALFLVKAAVDSRGEAYSQLPANLSSAEESVRLASATGAELSLPEIVVYKQATCGCCNRWIEHLEEHGFTVQAHDVDDVAEQKAEYGVRPEHHSCHTAMVDGYVIEGHVPADVILRLLDERPDVTGLTVPGMPMGSPGMEGPYAESYDVLTFDRAGNSTVYASR